MKKFWVLLINILLMSAIAGFVFLYTRKEQQKVTLSRIESFVDLTVAMEQVITNYLETEQGICDSWARNINVSGMTIEEAIEFVANSQKPGVSAQILFMDRPIVSGLSTIEKSNVPGEYKVSFIHFDLVKNIDEIGEPGDRITLTRAYTNPINGTQSIAFCNRISLLDSETGEPRSALLMRILPLKSFEKKWVFPIENYENTEISLVDYAGNYIIKGKSFKNTNFFEFYKSYNQINYADLNALQAEFRESTGSEQILNSRREKCLIAHTQVNASDGWAIISYVPMTEISEGSYDLTLLVLTVIGLAALFIFDTVLLLSLNRQLTATAKEAEKANRAKTDFLSTMSHDIRTPMNAIIGLTTIAEKNVEDPAAVGENLRKISLASNHLLTLINDILDISKVESGKLTLVPHTFSIAESAENLVNISQPMVKEKNINFDFRISPFRYEYLYADQLRLNQILINILSNALKYTPMNGSVTVDMTELPGSEDGMVRLKYCVADTGIGMTPEFMAMMYQPFSRQTDSRVNVIQGTGLGLAITKQMVDMMGGTIDCQSEPNKGTTFTIEIEIPIAERQLDEMDLEKISILVVDDDEILLETAKDTLESLDAIPETTDNGPDAVRLIRERHEAGQDYDIAIIDWKIPGMDGIEIIREIRASVSKDMPILLISAYDSSDFEDSARDAGANGFISKPLFRSTLYNKIKDLLGMEKDIQTPEEDDSDIAGMQILVAEDNEINWEIISMLLEMHGIKCERAANGQIAVEMAEAGRDKYDLIFMDIQMPVMNGLDAARAIRALPDPAASSLPIIAMTADAFSENVAECLEAGMNGHIAKPIDIKLVLKEIRRIRERSRKTE